MTSREHPVSMMKLSSAECRLVADITDVTIDVGENEETEYAWSPCLFTKEEFFFVKRTPVEDAGPEKRAAMAASS